MGFTLSFASLVGKEIAENYIRAAAFWGALTEAEARVIAFEEVDMLPAAWLEKQEALLEKVGTQAAPPVASTCKGAGPAAYDKVTNTAAAPLSGYGAFRIGEDGRLYFAAKSEHYHIPFGHSYPGYKLLENARKLGVPNATHNNTRGHIVRLLEQELVRQAGYGDEKPGYPKLDRVHNLETGSIACEAAIKYMLSRFYRTAENFDIPQYSGKTPVFLVMQDNDGGPKAGYHGTSVHAQTLRGMWPEYKQKAEGCGLYRVVPVKPNDIADFEAKLKENNQGECRVAGFLHEIILMNYGALRLGEEYLHAAHALCRQADVPVLVDEIQSCAWYPPDGFLFKRYGLRPDFVTIGKGFPGGEYASSRLLLDSRFDRLAQFDALVTNGQQELSALCFLITFRLLAAMQPQVQAVAKLLESEFAQLAAKYPGSITRVMGDGHMSALEFATVDAAVGFAKALNARCIDASAQTYKASCPPTVLMKLPVVSTEKTVRWLAGVMDGVLAGL